jgi:acyl-CoA hydrolase
MGTLNKQDERDLSTLASFTLKNCGSAVGWGGFKRNDEGTKMLCDKFGPQDRTAKVYKLADLTVEDTIVKDLFQHGSFFSVKPLQVMTKVRHAINSKASRKEASLEQILKLKE